jgi:hypothetical protein
MFIIDKITLIGVITFIAISYYLIKLCVSDKNCKVK